MGAAAFERRFAISIRGVVEAGSCGDEREREGHAANRGSIVLDHGVFEITVPHFLDKSPPLKYGSSIETLERSAPDSFKRRSVIRPVIPAPTMHVDFISTVKYYLRTLGILK
jgi:hypothetical protein